MLPAKVPGVIRTAALVLAASAAVGACGTGDNRDRVGDDASVRQKILAAVNTTEHAGSAQVTMTLRDVLRSRGASTVSMTTQHGLVDFGRGFDLTEQQPTGATVETRRIGTTVYTRLPADLLAAQHERKPWLRDSVPSTARHGALASLFGPTVDPSAVRALLRYSPQARRVGDATIAGTLTTHYTVDLDLAKLAHTGRHASACSADPFGAASRSSIGIWIDQQQRIRQLRTAVPLPEPASLDRSSHAAPATGTLTTTVRFSDYGVRVSLHAPPPSQVTTTAALLREQNKSLPRTTATYSPLPCPSPTHSPSTR